MRVLTWGFLVGHAGGGLAGKAPHPLGRSMQYLLDVVEVETRQQVPLAVVTLEDLHRRFLSTPTQGQIERDGMDVGRHLTGITGPYLLYI